jgi:hypothetical protein
MRVTKISWTLLMVLGCGGVDADREPSFDLWCGDALCEWELESGAVSSIPTWHPEERGIAFTGTNTSISKRFDVDPGACLYFRILAHVSPKANLRLELDVLDDGLVDQRQRITVRRFQTAEFLERLPGWADRVRVRLVSMLHEVEIAQIGIQKVHSCGQLPPIDVQNRPPGVGCSEDRECASGLCSSERCTLCSDIRFSCPNDQVCNPVPSVARPRLSYDACIPAGSVPTGEPCRVSEACEEGSLCGVDGFQTRRICERRGQGAMGSLCLVDDECRSESCVDGVCE